MQVTDVDTLEPPLRPLPSPHPDQLAHGLLPTVQRQEGAWLSLHQDTSHILVLTGQAAPCPQEGDHGVADTPSMVFPFSRIADFASLSWQ